MLSGSFIVALEDILGGKRFISSAMIPSVVIRSFSFSAESFLLYSFKCSTWSLISLIIVLLFSKSPYVLDGLYIIILF